MSWTTNHNKAAVCGLVSQPVMAYVGHLTWQLSVATLAVASSTPVVTAVFVNVAFSYENKILTKNFGCLQLVLFSLQTIVFSDASANCLSE